MAQAYFSLKTIDDREMPYVHHKPNLPPNLNCPSKALNIQQFEFGELPFRERSNETRHRTNSDCTADSPRISAASTTRPGAAKPLCN
jgi:hypothetical protein